jgi:hypothetical protein
LLDQIETTTLDSHSSISLGVQRLDVSLLSDYAALIRPAKPRCIQDSVCGRGSANLPGVHGFAGRRTGRGLISGKVFPGEGLGTVNFKYTCAFKALPPRFISALIGMNVWQENKSPAAIGKTAGRSAQKGEKKAPKGNNKSGRIRKKFPLKNGSCYRNRCPGTRKPRDIYL